MIGRLQNVDRVGGIVGHGASKEVSASAKAELGRAEGVFNSAIGRRLAHEATGRCGRILSFCEAVDAVVQQYHVATNGQSVAVAANLPDGEVGVHPLCACGDGCCTAVNGLHGVGVDIIGQAARAADA